MRANRDGPSAFSTLKAPAQFGMPFDLAATAGLAEPRASPVVAISAARAVHSKAIASARIPQWEAWRETAHRIKAWTIAHLGQLLVQFEEQVTARGGKVLWAEDAAQANAIILDIARGKGVRTVVKAKSMATEEIALNHALADAGIRSMETDLGEYIVQLAGQRPTHIIGPAMHMSAADIGKLFVEKLGMAYTESPENLIAEARKRLRQERWSSSKMKAMAACRWLPRLSTSRSWALRKSCPGWPTCRCF